MLRDDVIEWMKAEATYEAKLKAAGKAREEMEAAMAARRKCESVLAGHTIDRPEINLIVGDTVVRIVRTGKTTQGEILCHVSQSKVDTE